MALDIDVEQWHADPVCVELGGNARVKIEAAPRTRLKPPRETVEIAGQRQFHSFF